MVVLGETLENQERFYNDFARSEKKRKYFYILVTLPEKRFKRCSLTKRWRVLKHVSKRKRGMGAREKRIFIRLYGFLL
jgi:hypothetical protein